MSDPEPTAIARYPVVYVFRSDQCSLHRDIETGEPVFAIRRARGAADYEDHYRISEEELALFLEDHAALAAFEGRVDRRELEDRLIPPQPAVDADAPGPRFRAMYVNRGDRYALERDRRSGAPVFSIPVSNSLADYCEYYALSEDEFRAMVEDKALARDFARRCGRRELDERLIFQPGTDRGIY